MPTSRTGSNTDEYRPAIFVSYSHRDEAYRRKLETHMAQLLREGVEIWFDGRITPGDEIDPAIGRKLKRADVFLALASPEYLASSYCYDVEYGYAIRKARRGRLHVVVALLRNCQWRRTRMARHKLLPTDGKSVDRWARRGDAYEDIVEGIRQVLKVVTAEQGEGVPRQRMTSTRGATAARKTSTSRASAATTNNGKGQVKRPREQGAAAKAAGDRTAAAKVKRGQSRVPAVRPARAASRKVKPKT